MQKKFENKGMRLHVGDLAATLFFDGPMSLSMVTFDKELLDMYAEDYIKANFELTENDGWVRILKGGNQNESKI